MKTELRKAILNKALQDPFFGKEDVIDAFAEAYMLNIENARDRHNLDVAIQQRSI